jgi:hypothetical protein
MRMPGFTADTATRRSTTHYSGTAAHSSAATGGQLRPALVAQQQCRTSSCLAIGRCKTKVRCCRSFNGTCSCTAVPCFFLGPPETV